MILQTLNYFSMILLMSMGISWYFTQNMQILAFFAGGLWGSLNISIIALFIRTILITHQYLLAFFFILIKFPLFYGIGYFLLQNDQWNPWYLVLGLTSVFVALLTRLIFQFSFRSVKI